MYNITLIYKYNSNIGLHATVMHRFVDGLITYSSM